jgi:hypothetical protein
MCLTVNVPSVTAENDSGNIFMQITAPTTYSWVGFGSGTSMIGANAFVIYPDAAGTNVTLSPRLPTAHSTPSYNSAAQATLLSGSGIVDDVMVANIKCRFLSSSNDITHADYGQAQTAYNGHMEHSM